MQFHSLTTAALNGNYDEDHSAFFKVRDTDSQSTRLCAAVHRLNSAFATSMRDNGHKMKLQKVGQKGSEKNDTPSAGDLTLVTDDAKAWVKKVMPLHQGYSKYSNMCRYMPLLEGKNFREIIIMSCYLSCSIFNRASEMVL